MNIKMYLPDTAEKPREELSREIQEHAFKLGGEWLSGDKKALHTSEPFLFIDKDSNIRYSDDKNYTYFRENSDCIEITPEQFLAIQIPEPMFDESKIITWSNRHEAVVGREYYFGDETDQLRRNYKIGECGWLFGIGDKLIGYPFAIERCGVTRYAAIYPVED